MEAKNSADIALAEEDDPDTSEIKSRDLNLTAALAINDGTALDYMRPQLFPQYLFLASMHVIPYCTTRELLVVRDLFVRLMEKDLLEFRSDLFRENLGPEEIKQEDINIEVLSLCFILRAIVVFDDEESSVNTSLALDWPHVIKIFVSLAEVRTEKVLNILTVK